ncbi:MAG: ferrous iron transport protein A [Firmicutes bacterium]|jgi:ferrous iron transport protein A|nr:ferrous iron transport protein A [Bacillota bacterium]
MELTALPIGKSAIIAGLKAKGLMRRRLLDLGLVPATTIEAVRRSPAGDPVAYRVRGTVIALRAEESRLITVRP